MYSTWQITPEHESNTQQVPNRSNVFQEKIAKLTSSWFIPLFHAIATQDVRSMHNQYSNIQFIYEILCTTYIVQLIYTDETSDIFPPS